MVGGGLLLVLAACSSSTDSGSSSSTRPDSGVLGEAFTAPPPPVLVPARISEGEQLYEQYCAACHKADLSGDPNWKMANEDGTYPPPPHDNTGHTWHHPDQLLAGIIMDGIDDVPSSMPKYGGTLTDDQVRSILEFFKSGWGETERAFQWQVTWQDQE